MPEKLYYSKLIGKYKDNAKKNRGHHERNNTKNKN